MKLGPVRELAGRKAPFEGVLVLVLRENALLGCTIAARDMHGIAGLR